MEIMKKEVEFNGINLTGIKTQEGKIYIVVKTFCEALGVFPNSQIKRIRRDDFLNEGGVIMALPTNGGQQDVFLLELDFLPMWLTGIKSDRCREEIRPYLKEFKLKAKDILSEAFFGKRELLLPGHNDEKFNPSLNDIDNRVPLVRSIEAEIVRLYGVLRYHYKWIKERTRTQETECENQIKKMKQKFFIVDGEELTTEDIDKLNHM